MSWNVDQVYSFLKFLIRKNQAGGIKSTDFFFAWNSEQKAYQSDLLGRWQARSNGKSGLNTGLIQDETITQKLSPFTIPITLTVTSGSASKPSDIVYRLGLRVNGVNAYKINHSQIATVNDNVIDPPSISTNTTYFVESDSQYKFLPTAVPSCDLDYIAAPTDIVWAYTLDGNNRQVYDSANSVQPLWDDLSIIDITKRALKSLGVSFKDADFTNFGQSNIVTGD